MKVTKTFSITFDEPDYNWLSDKNLELLLATGLPKIGHFQVEDLTEPMIYDKAWGRLEEIEEPIKPRLLEDIGILYFINKVLLHPLNMELVVDTDSYGSGVLVYSEGGEPIEDHAIAFTKLSNYLDLIQLKKLNEPLYKYILDKIKIFEYVRSDVEGAYESNVIKGPNLPITEDPPEKLPNKKWIVSEMAGIPSQSESAPSPVLDTDPPDVVYEYIEHKNFSNKKCTSTNYVKEPLKSGGKLFMCVDCGRTLE